MPQSISHTTISDHWAPVPDIIKTERLRLTKRRPRTPGPPEDHGSSGAHHINGNINGVSTLSQSTVQRPPQSAGPSSFFDQEDPAFSSDPFHHPDHDGPSVTEDMRKEYVGNGGPSLAWHGLEVEAEAEPPPAYDDSEPGSYGYEQLKSPQLNDQPTSLQASSSGEDVRGTSSHIRERAQTSYSPSSTPFSSSSNLSQPQQSVQDDITEQEELLAYLSDDRKGFDSTPDRDIPMSLRPHRGIPMINQDPADSQARGPSTTSLLRSTTMPSAATRSISEPLARTKTERPRPPPRGNTTPRHAPENLDRIDELDESVPLGVPFHHRGPYEMRGKVDTPPPRVVPLDRQLQSPPKQHVLVAVTPLNAPPQPVPFRLNLKPGEILTRVPPPSRSQTAPPERNPPSTMGYYPSMATEQPVHKRSRPTAQKQVDPRLVYQSNSHNEWSPERLYEDYASAPPQILPRDAHRFPYQADVRNNTPSSSASTSRSDLRPIIGPNSDQRLQQGRAGSQKQVSFQQFPQQEPSLSRSMSQPVQPSSASQYSTSSTSLSRAPPSAADRFRPKRIVLPAPLQPQNQNQNRNSTYTLPSELMRNTGQNSTPAAAQSPQPAAAVIPVHDPKKGNLLKKRASIGTAMHRNHNHLIPERTTSIKGFFGLGGGFGKGLTSEPEADFPKANRKLSKRGKVL